MDFIENLFVVFGCKKGIECLIFSKGNLIVKVLGCKDILEFELSIYKFLRVSELGLFLKPLYVMKNSFPDVIA